jgi:hypothetical protein
MFLVGCAQPLQAPPGWKFAFTTNFKDAAKLPEAWTVIEGQARIADGKLVLTAEEFAHGQIVLKTSRFPGSVRLEADASLQGTDVCDLSPLLNGNETGWDSGYLLQFGAAENVENRMRRIEEIVDAKANNTIFVTPAKTHHLVAENDGGKLRLIVDGTEILSYTDSQPLQGEGHDQIGFYTWNCTLQIEKITIYTKADPAK